MKQAGGLDEGLRQVDPENVHAEAAELKARASDRASHIERPGAGGESTGIDEFMHTAHRKIARVTRGRKLAENRLLRAVVKQEVFGEELLGFVGIQHMLREAVRFRLIPRPFLAAAT